MKTKLAALLVPWLIGFLVPYAIGQDAESPPERAEQFLIHLELEKLAQTRSGQRLIESVFQIPHIDKQIAAIPESLQFLRTAKIKSITWSSNSELHDSAPLLEIEGQVDQQRLRDVLSYANGYAQVEFGGIEIHHWVTDFDSLAEQFLGTQSVDREPGSLEDKNPDTVFLAMPRPDRMIVSTSLAKVTGILSGKSTHPQDLRDFVGEQFEGDSLFSLYVSGGDAEVPGDLAAVIQDGESGRLDLHATVTSRNQMEQSTIETIASVLSNPEMAIQMIGINVASAEEQGAAGDKPIAKVTEKVEVESGKAAPGNMGQVSISFAYNSGTIDKEDWKVMMSRFLEDCVQCRCEGNELFLDVSVFWGPCQWFDTTDQQVGKPEGYRSELFLFNVYSTQEEMNAAATRVAEQGASGVDR